MVAQLVHHLSSCDSSGLWRAEVHLSLFESCAATLASVSPRLVLVVQIDFLIRARVLS